LRAKTGKLGLENLVTWKGEQPSARDFLGEIDCLIISSDREPFSIAMLESLATGVPVLAADSGGAKDVIVPALNGWLYRSGDINELGSALALLANTDALSGVNISPIDTQRYMAGHVASQWAEVYGALLGRK
jgi:glycosyltransferase involved in cell wall biosynthesis